MDNKGLTQNEMKDLLNRSHKNYEIERKFVLKSIPDIFISESKQCEIIQHYILDEFHDNSHQSMIRVRQITEKDNISYIQTIKTPIGADFAVSETETELTKEEFDYFVNKSNSSISKKRHTLYIEGNKWEIDQFHQLDLVIAELEKLGDNWSNAVELEKEIMNIKLPSIIQDVLIEEVTGKSEWSNKTLSLKIKNNNI